MVFINEWLPNPVGSDAAGEWIELFNDGSVPIDISAWSIQTLGGKEYKIPTMTLGAGEHRTFPRSATKLTLHNKDGALILFDASGRQIHSAEFIGGAPEGKSFSRVGAHFIFTEPTAAAKNKMPVLAASVETNYPNGVPFHPAPGLFMWVSLAVVVGVVCAWLPVFIISRNANTSELFFPRDN